MKKIVFIVLGVLCILSIVSCGYNEAKQKADEKLKKYNAKATFFCCGNNVNKNPELFIKA